jgi:D-3-phosphoglycerate dehydrogenase
MLLSSRGIIEGIEFAKHLDLEDSAALNKAMEAQKKTFAGNELGGKTLGIVGLGSIGSMLAQAAHTLGMKLIGYDPYISIEGAGDCLERLKKPKQWRLFYSNQIMFLFMFRLLRIQKTLSTQQI